jgi:hypothetical protein
MAERRDLIPIAVRIAVRNAVGGSGPFTVQQIEDLFNMHEFMERDESIPDAGGDRRTTAEQFHARIDWTSPDQARRYLHLVEDVLDRYPEAEDQPGSPGRDLRRAVERGGFVGSGGRLRLPGRQATSEAEPDVRGIWKPDQLRIFMSHVSAVKDDVSKVAAELESLQCSCFIAHIQIEPARDWQDVIEVALNTCHVLVAYVTPEFPASKWTDQEVGWALGRGVPVVPVNAGHQPYGFFGAVQSIAVSPSFPWRTGVAVFRAIATSSLRGGPFGSGEAAPLVARTVVRAFCESPSYDSTRQRFPLLDLIPAEMWTDDMISEVEEATRSNNQISDGMLSRNLTAPDAVRDLVARLRTVRR